MPICTSLTMPSSVSGRLISGSWTVARAAVTASSAGEPVSVSDIVACVSFDGGPAPRPACGQRRPAQSGRLPLYGGPRALAVGGGGAPARRPACGQRRPAQAGRLPLYGGRRTLPFGGG